MTTVDVQVVDIRKIMGAGNLKALADVRLANSVVVKGFSVMLGKKGVFVGMPRQAGKDGRWFDMLTPENSLKHEIQEKVLEAYDRETDGVEQ